MLVCVFGVQVECKTTVWLKQAAAAAVEETPGLDRNVCCVWKQSVVRQNTVFMFRNYV